MIPFNPVLVHTIDVTASLAPVIFSMALAALVCGAVLAVLAYDALRADPTVAPMSGTTETQRSTPSPLDPRAPRRAPLAA